MKAGADLAFVEVRCPDGSLWLLPWRSIQSPATLNVIRKHIARFVTGAEVGGWLGPAREIQ